MRSKFQKKRSFKVVIVTVTKLLIQGSSKILTSKLN